MGIFIIAVVFILSAACVALLQGSEIKSLRVDVTALQLRSGIKDEAPRSPEKH